MIYVFHRTPPNRLEDRLNNPDGSGRNPIEPRNAWRSFKGKSQVAASLKPIQYELCAYCENSLDVDIGNHIEHIKPKTQNPSLTFEYTNLMLSCFDDKHIPPKGSLKQQTLSCGHYKRDDDNPLFIKPTESNCEQFFEFDINGAINPCAGLNLQDSARARYTIDILNLNCNRLVRERKTIYQESIRIISELQSDQIAIQGFLNLEVMLVNGKYSPYINLRKQLKSWYESFI